MMYIEDSRTNHWFTQDFDKTVLQFRHICPKMSLMCFDLPHQEYVKLNGINYRVHQIFNEIQQLTINNLEQGE
jgi:hypothetical protein